MRAQTARVVRCPKTGELHARAPRTLGERLAYAMRQAAGRRPAGEAQRVTDAGTEVILIHPTVPDLDVMVTNLMSRARRHEVIETATRTVTDHLAASPIGERLARLSAGHPELVRRPAGPPADWPDLPAAARARWDRAPRRRAA